MSFSLDPNLYNFCLDEQDFSKLLDIPVDSSSHNVDDRISSTTTDLFASFPPLETPSLTANYSSNPPPLSCTDTSAKTSLDFFMQDNPSAASETTTPSNPSKDTLSTTTSLKPLPHSSVQEAMTISPIDISSIDFPLTYEPIALNYLKITDTKNASLEDVCLSISISIFEQKSVLISILSIEQYLKDFLNHYYLLKTPEDYARTNRHMDQTSFRKVINALRNLEHRFLARTSSIFHIDGQEVLGDSGIWNKHSKHLLFRLFFDYFARSQSKETGKRQYLIINLRSNGFYFNFNQISSKIQSLIQSYKRNPSGFFDRYSYIERELLHFFIDVNLHHFTADDIANFSLFSSIDVFHGLQTRYRWTTEELVTLLTHFNNGLNVRDISTHFSFKSDTEIKNKITYLKSRLKHNPDKFWAIQRRDRKLPPLLKKFAESAEEA